MEPSAGFDSAKTRDLGQPAVEDSVFAAFLGKGHFFLLFRTPIGVCRTVCCDMLMQVVYIAVEMTLNLGPCEVFIG